MNLGSLLGGTWKTAKTTSQTMCLAPIAGCLVKAEEVCRSSGAWLHVNMEQKRFLNEYYYDAKTQIRDLPELESIASSDEGVINQFLQERGFQISSPELGRHDLGLASVFKLLLEWTQPGSVTTLREEKFPAVYIKKGHHFSSSRHAENPLVSISAKNGDIVTMMVSEDPPSGMDLAALVQRIESDRRPVFEYENVIFPMIDYDQEIDISWVVKMSTMGGGMPWEIFRALQQTKFRMNEIGAKVESAVVMGTRMMFTQSAMKPDLIIDKPFLLWIKRKGLTHPLFIAHFTEEVWKKPSSL